MSTELDAQEVEEMEKVKLKPEKDASFVEDTGETDNIPMESSNIKGDEANIAILILFYSIQGLIGGIRYSIPMILGSRGISYTEQAGFSITSWPFSLKLLWAPVVESVFIPKLGRRKTWLLSVQYSMGILMLVSSNYVDGWLGNDDPNVKMLAILFFSLIFLVATQDIAVDGWSLTMLKRCNVGYSSTCTSVGQAAGFFVGSVIFMTFQSPEFCNRYIRSVPSDFGMITTSGFIFFWGCAIMIFTTLVGIFKHEKTETYLKKESMSIMYAYQAVWKIVLLPKIKIMILILLTTGISFSVSDAATELKLIEAGISKEKIALINMPLIPLKIIFSIIVSKYTSGPKPMDIYLKAIPFRLIAHLFEAILVWATSFVVSNGEVPVYFYGLLIASYSFDLISSMSMFVSIMAFNARISDPKFGAIYMTFLATLLNLGHSWSSTAALFFVDIFTYKTCSNDVSNVCRNAQAQKMCTTSGGVCSTQVDGYYVGTIICFIVGFVWLRCIRQSIKNLQSAPLSSWKVV